jgi:hypothetical protein
MANDRLIDRNGRGPEGAFIANLSSGPFCFGAGLGEYDQDFTAIGK